jgi:hypothetical protein
LRLRGDHTVVEGRRRRPGIDGRGRSGNRSSVDGRSFRGNDARSVGRGRRGDRPGIGAFSRLTGFGLIDSTLANHHGLAGVWLLGRGLRCLR